MRKYWATFNRFEFELPEAAVMDCYHSGACDADVECWLKKLKLDIDPQKLREELKEYGAWDEKDLADHDTNLARILWIAAGDIQDGEEFSNRGQDAD